MDALCRIRIPGEEMQVLNVILRKTYGWNKCEDAISLSQFVEMTMIKKPNVVRAIQGLLSKKIISVIEKDNPSLSKKIPTKATTTKDTITKAIAQEINFPDWLPQNTFKEYLAMRKTIKRPLSIQSYHRFFKSLKKLCNETRASPEEILNQSIVNSWQGIFELKTGVNNGTGQKFGRAERDQGVPPDYEGMPKPTDAEIEANRKRLAEITKQFTDTSHTIK